MLTFKILEFLKWLMVFLGMLAGKILGLIPNSVEANILMIWSGLAIWVQANEWKDDGSSAVTCDFIVLVGAVLGILFIAFGFKLSAWLIITLVFLSLPGVLYQIRSRNKS